MIGIEPPEINNGFQKRFLLYKKYIIHFKFKYTIKNQETQVKVITAMNNTLKVIMYNQIAFRTTNQK